MREDEERGEYRCHTTSLPPSHATSHVTRAVCGGRDKLHLGMWSMTFAYLSAACRRSHYSLPAVGSRARAQPADTAPRDITRSRYSGLGATQFVIARIVSYRGRRHGRAVAGRARAGAGVLPVRHAQLFLLAAARRRARQAHTLLRHQRAQLPAAHEHERAGGGRVPALPRRARRGLLPRQPARAGAARPGAGAACAGGGLRELLPARPHAAGPRARAAAAQPVLRGRRPVAAAAPAHDAQLHERQAARHVPARRRARRAPAGARPARRRRGPGDRRARPHGALHDRLHRRVRLRPRQRLAERRRLRLPPRRQEDLPARRQGDAGGDAARYVPSSVLAAERARARRGGVPAARGRGAAAARLPAVGAPRLHRLAARVQGQGRHGGGIAGAARAGRGASARHARDGRHDRGGAGVRVLRGWLRDLLVRHQYDAARAGAQPRGAAARAGRRGRGAGAPRRPPQLRRRQGDDVPGVDVHGGHARAAVAGRAAARERVPLHVRGAGAKHRPRRARGGASAGAAQRPAVLPRPARVPPRAPRPGAPPPRLQARVHALRRRPARLHRRAAGRDAVAGGAGGGAGALQRAARARRPAPPAPQPRLGPRAGRGRRTAARVRAATRRALTRTHMTRQ